MSQELGLSNIYNNFFLVHDFFLRLCKQNPHRPEFFDLQYDIQKKVQKAGRRGAYTMQLGIFAGLFVYCIRGNNKLFKLLGGFLYVKWINHFYTIGSYLGVLTALPSSCKKASKYYKQHPEENNKIDELKQYLNKYDDSQIDKALDKIFIKDLQGATDSYVANSFFLKNKDYFFKKQDQTPDNNNENKTELSSAQKLKLKYFDNFLTRYIYHNARRYIKEVRKDLGI